jgi:soluble lytic murein transglycosylase-like protein
VIEVNATCAALIALAIPRADVACSYVPEILERAASYDIRPTVMLSLMHEESRFRPDAVSKAGACGMTQVLPRYTKNPKLSCRALLDPTISIEAGTKALSRWYNSKYAKRDYRIALCAYNAGYRCKKGQQLYSKRGAGYARRVLRRAEALKKKINYFLVHAAAAAPHPTLHSCKIIVE